MRKGLRGQSVWRKVFEFPRFELGVVKMADRVGVERERSADRDDATDDRQRDDEVLRDGLRLLAERLLGLVTAPHKASPPGDWTVNPPAGR